MFAKLRFSTIHAGLLLFWAIWLTLVAFTNLADALKRLQLLPEDWTLASYNYDLVVQTLQPHGVPEAVAALLFAGVIVWEATAAALLWRAFAAVRRGAPGTAPEVTQAFAVSLALWAAFLIATEATVNYLTASTHKETLIAQLASLLVIRSGDTPAAVPVGAVAERDVGGAV